MKKLTRKFIVWILGKRVKRFDYRKILSKRAVEVIGLNKVREDMVKEIAKEMYSQGFFNIEVENEEKTLKLKASIYSIK